jgi:hypothetical protein
MNLSVENPLPSLSFRMPSGMRPTHPVRCPVSASTDVEAGIPPPPHAAGCNLASLVSAHRRRQPENNKTRKKSLPPTKYSADPPPATLSG